MNFLYPKNLKGFFDSALSKLFMENQEDTEEIKLKIKEILEYLQKMIQEKIDTRKYPDA